MDEVQTALDSLVLVQQRPSNYWHLPLAAILIAILVARQKSKTAAEIGASRTERTKKGYGKVFVILALLVYVVALIYTML